MIYTLSKSINFMTKLIYNGSLKYSLLSNSNKIARFASNSDICFKHDVSFIY